MDLKKIIKQSRIEVLPVKSVFSQLKYIKEGSTINVATHDLKKTLDFVKFAENNYEFSLVPHLPARLFESEAHLRETLDFLVEKNVKEIFVIGGDEKIPKGPYQDSLQLLEKMDELGYLGKFKEISTGIYPGGHPFISDEVLFDFMRRKQPYITSMITNLEFNPERVVRYIGEIRSKGIEKPVMIGILGKVRKNNLFSLLKDFSPKKTVSYLKSHPLLLFNLTLGRYNPDKFLNKVECCLGENMYNVRGLVFFTLNSIESHCEWIRSLDKQG